jgi:hypothetical protein
VFVGIRVRNAEFPQFMYETVRECELFVRGRADAGAFRTLRGNSDVFEETFKSCHGSFPFPKKFCYSIQDFSAENKRKFLQEFKNPSQQSDNIQYVQKFP